MVEKQQTQNLKFWSISRETMYRMTTTDKDYGYTEYAPAIKDFDVQEMPIFKIFL